MSSLLVGVPPLHHLNRLAARQKLGLPRRPRRSYIACMCGRFALDMKEERLALLFGIDEVLDNLPPRYNVAPGQAIAVVGLKPDGARRGLAKLNWGFVPRWANDPKSGPRPINARAETLLDKSFFREAFLQRRCIIPASGFFEWKSLGRKKQPHYIRLRDDSPMAFAGLWDIWGQGPNKLATCCIITVVANELVAPLHDRMAAILPDAALDEWLDPNTSPERALSLLATRDSAGMEIIRVGPTVNHVANEGSECIAPNT